MRLRARRGVVFSGNAPGEVFDARWVRIVRTAFMGNLQIVPRDKRGNDGEPIPLVFADDSWIPVEDADGNPARLRIEFASVADAAIGCIADIEWIESHGPVQAPPPLPAVRRIFIQQLIASTSATQDLTAILDGRLFEEFSVEGQWVGSAVTTGDRLVLFPQYFLDDGVTQISNANVSGRNDIADTLAATTTAPQTCDIWLRIGAQVDDTKLNGAWIQATAFSCRVPGKFKLQQSLIAGAPTSTFNGQLSGIPRR